MLTKTTATYFALKNNGLMPIANNDMIKGNESDVANVDVELQAKTDDIFLICDSFPLIMSRYNVLLLN